jgi:hypothetical protein
VSNAGTIRAATYTDASRDDETTQRVVNEHDHRSICLYSQLDSPVALEINPILCLRHR